MSAGAADKLRGMADVVDLLDAYEQREKDRQKAASDERREQAYSRFGDALGGKGVRF